MTLHTRDPQGTEVPDLLRRFAPYIGGRIWYSYQNSLMSHHKQWYAGIVVGVDGSSVQWQYLEGPRKDTIDTCSWVILEDEEVSLWELNDRLRYDVKR
jgi:hypothetical protein